MEKCKVLIGVFMKKPISEVKVNTAVLGRYIVICPLAQKQNIFDKILENLTQTEIRKIMNHYQVELAHNRRFMSS